MPLSSGPESIPILSPLKNPVIMPGTPLNMPVLKYAYLKKREIKLRAVKHTLIVLLSLRGSQS